MQPPPVFGAVEGFQEIPPGDGPEFVEYLFGGIEFDRKGMQPRLPRAGGAAAEVRRHVLDHQRRNQLRTLGGEAPRVQGAHRVPDQRGRRPQRAHRVGQIGHETFGADRVWVVDVTTAVPQGVVGVHGAQPGQPR